MITTPNLNSKPGFFFALFFLVLLTLGILFLIQKNSQTITPQTTQVSDPFVEINQKKIFVELANTPDKKTKGLSGKTSLEENKGMLFDYKVKNIPGFWMKDMKISIDIIWIADNTVIDIDKEVQPQPGVPDSGLKIYQPKEPINYVLEVNSGYSDKNGIDIGSEVKFSI